MNPEKSIEDSARLNDDTICYNNLVQHSHWDAEQSTSEELRDFLQKENERMYEILSLDPALCAAVE